METDLDLEMFESLNDAFRYGSFKSNEQRNATWTVLTETCDVLINLPPAAGKSLCFQLPGVMFPNKITIVIVPDNNTLEEQVEYLENKKIDVQFFNSKFYKKNFENFINKLNDGNSVPRFIYVTIAVCASDLFKELIKKLYDKDLILTFVVDEAHCASDKSIDYNKSYKEIIPIRDSCPNVRLIALTSIGTGDINNDIKTSLKMLNAIENNGSYNWIRPNIYIDVKFKDILDPFDDLTQLITNFKQAMDNFSGIIFCRKREETILVANELSRRGIPTASYSSKLDHNERVKTKKDWMRGKVVMLAVTHGLGVGLNKFGVGCVIHWSLPLTMEQYYRDVGRAGRFGGKALSRIYLGVEDWMNAQYLMMGKSSHLFSSFENVLQFCVADACRHVLYSKYFGFNAEPCQMACDACERDSHYEKSLEKFKIYNNQRRLLPKHLKLPITEIYKPQPIRMIRREKVDVRVHNYRQLVLALRNNFKRAENLNKYNSQIEHENLCRLARNLEYIAFSTNLKMSKYWSAIRRASKSIHDDAISKTLSNYIKNYKFKSE
ncbi:ATP-dependent DNA helicase Q5-like [Microplitis mediator]|uniref:ATP-dependent DNA helicase Q5-like n=1 Tax=Microplitis mediator TaxID=375433 RepID=UPI0025546CDD|nr:ATP-dependent DNA helicase Q5-like [Microplitis mediator]